MNKRFSLSFCALTLFLAVPLLAQTTTATLTGTVKDISGNTLANAKISVKNTESGQTTAAAVDATGAYSISLAPGSYEITVAADGFVAKTASATLAPGASQSMDFALVSASGNAVRPSLNDLGFPQEQSQGSAADQARLDRRSHMLKIHQRLGLITLIPLVATIIASSQAGGRHPSATGRDVHGALGATTAAFYFTTAYFAIRAPKIQGTHARGQIRLHKALAWVHGPGMVLTPILGAMAFNQESNGEKVHGIAKAHGAVAAVTYTAFGLAVLSVTIKF